MTLFVQSIIDTQLANSSSINNGEIHAYENLLVYK